MLERWAIVAAPSKTDPQRYTLLMKADVVDIHAIIRRFGVICGRPQKEKIKKRYSHSLYLRGLTDAKRQQLEKFLQMLNPNASCIQEESVPSVAVPSPAPPPPPPPRAPHFTPSPGNENARPSPAPARPALPTTGNRDVQARDIRPAPAPDGIRCPLDPLNTFDFLTVGPFNRFAHAASMAVVSSPGTIYNPLLLYGAPGVGKTHILMAIAHGLQNQSPRKPVLCTSGPMLARAVRLAATSKRISEIENLIKESKGLVIDDVHLMEISEQNQQGLTAVLTHCFNNNKPVIMSSVYPPQALRAMEEALKFQISSGWSVEMKMPNAETQKTIMGIALARMGFESEETNILALEESLGSNFSEMMRRLREMKFLAQSWAQKGHPASFNDLNNAFRTVDAVSSPPPTADQIRALGSLYSPTSVSTDRFRHLAVFSPQKHEECSPYMLAQLDKVAKENDIPCCWKVILQQPYSADDVYGLPFSLADAAEKGKADAVLVLGPHQRSALAGREAEIHHALDRLFGNLQIRFGLVPFSKIQNPGPYFHAALEFVIGL